MSDGGIMVLDGTDLVNTVCRLPNLNGAVSGSQLIDLCESEAPKHLFGLLLPDSVKTAVRRRFDNGGDNFDGKSQEAVIKEYFTALADHLKDEPLVVSILDGSALRVFLDDEDDFAMLAENLFTDLDVDDRGKLSKSEIQNGLVRMGVGMGVPPFSESRDLLNDILKKHGAEGEEELGQAQFAQLLQTVLQDLADALAQKHVTVIHNIKVVNGSKLNKILGDEKLFDGLIEKIFQDWNTTIAGASNKEHFRAVLELKGTELGLPPSESNESAVILYDQIFTDVGEEMFAADLDGNSFQKVARVILKMFADQLEANPIFIELES